MPCRNMGIVRVSLCMNRFGRLFSVVLVALSLVVSGAGWTMSGALAIGTSQSSGHHSQALDHSHSEMSSSHSQASCDLSDDGSCDRPDQASDAGDTCCGTGCHVATYQCQTTQPLAFARPVGEAGTPRSVRSSSPDRLERPPKSAAQ
jgi:hypothetical protein